MSLSVRKVLVTDTELLSFDIEQAILGPLGAEIVLASSTDESTLVAEAAGAIVILVDQAAVGEAVIASAARGGCRAIVRYGIGYENVDLRAAERYGIPVANVPDYCIDEVADHTMALLLAHARKVIDAANTTRTGGWQIPKGQVPRLAGRRVGLIGLGSIGRRVATRAASFGLVVIAHDPIAGRDEPGVLMVDLPELLETADYISLHLPLSAETANLIDSDAVRVMKQKPLLINTSRGGLVDLDRIAWALDNGYLSGVALDVFANEPLPADHPLRTHPLAILTPHMAYYSNESESELAKRVGEEAARAIRGEPLFNPVTRIRLATARAT